jgi:hypothetical protein
MILGLGVDDEDPMVAKYTERATVSDAAASYYQA